MPPIEGISIRGADLVPIDSEKPERDEQIVGKELADVRRAIHNLGGKIIGEFILQTPVQTTRSSGGQRSDVHLIYQYGDDEPETT